MFPTYLNILTEQSQEPVINFFCFFKYTISLIELSWAGNGFDLEP